MMDDSDTVSDESTVPASRVRAPIRLLLVIGAGIVAAVVVLIPKNNQESAGYLAAFWAVMALGLLDRALFGRRRDLLTVRLIIALVVGAGIGQLVSFGCGLCV